MKAYSMQMLQRAQNRAMRAILGCNRYTPVIYMLEALCFMSIKQKMVYNVCLMICKYAKYKWHRPSVVKPTSQENK